MKQTQLIGDNRERKSNIIDATTPEGKRILEEILAGIPDKNAKAEETPIENEEPKTKTKTNSDIINLSDFWRIENVNYRGKIGDYELLKTLLDNGNTKTQDEWVEYSKIAKPQGDFYVGDMPLYHSIFTALSRLDNPDAEQAREFIKKEIRAKYPMTLTRIKYSPKEKDEVINNFKMNDEYKIQANFVGKDGFIKDVQDKDYLNAILGTDNIPEINEVYQKINQTDAYIWRVNKKPKSIDESVARFIADSDWVDLDCDRYPAYSLSAFGVRGCNARGN